MSYHFSCGFQGVVLVGLCMVQMSGHVTFCFRFQHQVLVTLHDAESIYENGVYLFMLFLSLIVCPFVDLCQTRVGRQYDKTNIRW